MIKFVLKFLFAYCVFPVFYVLVCLWDFREAVTLSQFKEVMKSQWKWVIDESF